MITSIIQIAILALAVFLFVPVATWLIGEVRSARTRAEANHLRVSARTYLAIVNEGVPFLISLVGVIIVGALAAFGPTVTAIPLDLVIVLILSSMMAVMVSEKSSRKESQPLRVFDSSEDSVGAIQEAIMHRLHKAGSVEVFVWAGGGKDSARRFHQMMEGARLETVKAPKIKVRIAIYDADEAQKNGWSELATRSREAEGIFKGLKDSILVHEKGIDLDYRKYKYDPTIQGTWVKEEALFMGAFYWRTKDDLPTYPELISTPKPFVQIGTNHELYRFWTSVFENWFDKFWDSKEPK